MGQVPTYSKFDYLHISMHMHALALKPNRRVVQQCCHGYDGNENKINPH